MAAKSGGSENMTRLGMAIIDEYTQILRDILSMHIPQAQLYNDVKVKNIRLRPEQETLVAKARMAGYLNFDITLLYSLIRNLSLKIPKPTRGWGDSSGPRPGDITLGDDIERIRILRNVIYGHIPSTFISDADFRTYWSEISDVCKRMEKATGGNYVKHIIELETCTIDEHTEQKYQKMIESERELKEEIKEDIRAVHQEIKDLREWMKDPKSREENPRTSLKVTPSCKLSHEDKVNVLEEIACHSFNTIIEEIDENTSKENIFRILDEILILDDSSNMSDSVLDLIIKLKAKVNWYKSVKKITGTEIMFKFTQLTVRLMARYNLKSSTMGSLIFNFEFHSEAVSARYRSDFDSGILKKLLSEVLLFPAFLSLLGLSMKDVNLEVEKFPEVIISEGRQQADVQPGEQDVQSIGRSVSSIASYRSIMATDPRAQHYVECTECDRNAEYYCNTCTDSLCTQCKKKHESKHHDVVIYREKRTVELCNIHSTLPYTMCCQQCEVPVCQKCIKENHKKHSFVDIEDVYESKQEEYHDHICKIRDELLPKSTFLLKDVQSDSVKCKNEISQIQSEMTSKAQAIKDIIDAILAENTAFLQGLENSLISELHQQEKTMNSHIAYLQNIVDEYEKYILTKQHARFILFQHDNPMSEVKEIPKLTEINLPSITDVKVNKEDIARLLGKVKESTKPSVMRKVRNIHDTSMKLIPTATMMMSFTAPGVDYSHHISPVTADQVWISDNQGNLVLTDMNGNKLNEMKYAYDSYGCHTTSDTGELIFLNKEDDGIYKVTANKKKPTHFTKVPKRKVSSIYSSPSNGDILVGMCDPGRVICYKKTGQEVHQIQYDNTGQPLYDYPRYITENHINGDVCVSDCNKHAVVVVDRDRNYRFSYTGHPPGSELKPYGISTDTQGHILVSYEISNTVQMTDKDGHFLSFLLTTEQGIDRPAGLSLDVRNNLLWVGERWNNTVSVYRYNPSNNM